MPEVDLTNAPWGVQQLPLYRGIPVPYTAKWNGDVPDFKDLDHERWVRALTQRLCGVCGRPLLPEPMEMAFIGGERSMQTRMFNDPPMHKSCAEWVFKLCPFVGGDKDYSASTKDARTPLEARDRPAEMFMGITRGFRVGKLQGVPVIQADSWIRVVPGAEILGEPT
jgi:hypothetical protein